MYLNNYQHLKNKETFILIFLILSSIIVRIPVILIFGDTDLQNEWKVIVENLINHNQLSYRNFGDLFIPNLYMPPLYSFYLYFFSIFNLGQQNYILIILLSQVLLASISIVIFYKLNKLFFSQRISFYGSLILSFFPLYIYASSQISSITLQVFLIILFFYFFLRFIVKKNILLIFALSFVSALLLILRGEFIAIFILTLIYSFLFFKIKIKEILLILLISLLIVSPYIIRNVIIFKTATITKSFGYNLWKGNNPKSIVEGSELINVDLQNQIKKIPKNKFYQINLDKIFLDQAIQNITNEPQRYLVLFFKKFFSFLFIDFQSSNPNYYHPLHYLPVLLLGFTSLIGIFLYDKKSNKLNYLTLIFFASALIYSSLFILARYKLAILPLQIIFSNVLISYLMDFFQKKRSKAKN